MLFFFYNFFLFSFLPKKLEIFEIFSFYNVNSINFERKKNRQFFDITKLEGKIIIINKNPWNLQGPNSIKPD
jgi:hypothetical protein